MAGNGTDDRRKYHRIATDQVISFAEIDRPDRLAVGKNVSTGGISFEAVGCEIELGDLLRVTFNVMQQTVVATGLVVWATDSDPISTEVGIEFIEIDPLALRLLEESMEPDSETMEESVHPALSAIEETQ
ncbi:MAG: PilZ domain-containing protein [Myxococcales bacterium]|nr:PilZ domain-containing protein [Myxococcales bacterium]MCH7869601.1 PilZ domain-containing protein [Myxococcales bacterium]